MQTVIEFCIFWIGLSFVYFIIQMLAFPKVDSHNTLTYGMEWGKILSSCEDVSVHWLINSTQKINILQVQGASLLYIASSAGVSFHFSLCYHVICTYYTMINSCPQETEQNLFYLGHQQRLNFVPLGWKTTFFIDVGILLQHVTW